MLGVCDLGVLEFRTLDIGLRREIKVNSLVFIVQHSSFRFRVQCGGFNSPDPNNPPKSSTPPKLRDFR